MAKATRRGNPQVARAAVCVRKAVRELERLGIRVERAILYGSFAKGSPGKWSDIDVALVCPDFRPEEMAQWVRIALTCHRVDPRIEPVVYRPADLRDEEPLAWAIRRTGIDVVP